MASIAASQAHPSHYMYQVDQASTESPTDTETETLVLFPMRKNQTISQFLSDAKWGKVKKSYSDLLDSYVRWINQNGASTDGSTQKVTNFKDKILDSPKKMNETFNAAVFGNIHAQLRRVRQLLDDEAIPLDTRKSVCDDIAFRMEYCIEGFKSDLQVGLLILLAVKNGCAGEIQQKRLDIAKQIAVQAIKDRAYNGCWEVHLVNYLISTVAIQYGLPSFKFDEYIEHRTVQSIASKTVLDNFRRTLQLRLSPCGIYRAIVDNCLEHYQLAIIASNLSIGNTYTLEQLDTGQINEQIIACTASIREYIKNFNFEFSLIIEEVSDDAEASSETDPLYRISLKKLKFNLMQHIFTNIAPQNELTSADEQQWDLSQKLLENATVDHHRLFFVAQLYFCVEEGGGERRGVTLQDISTFDFKDFSESTKFELMTEAIENTNDIDLLNKYYNNEIKDKLDDRLFYELSRVFFAHLQTPEITVAIDKWADSLLLTTNVNSYAMFQLTAVRNRTSVQFLIKKTSFIDQLNKQEGEDLLNTFPERMSREFLEVYYIRKHLQSYLFKACKTDNVNVIKALLTSPKITDAYLQTTCVIHGGPKFLYSHAIHICIMNNSNKCLLELIKHDGQTEQTTGIDTKLTALHLAVIYNKIEAVSILIEANADINAQSKNGYTPLHWAIYYKRSDIISLLLGCKTKPDLSLKDTNSRSAYSFAMKSKNSIKALFFTADTLPSNEDSRLKELDLLDDQYLEVSINTH